MPGQGRVGQERPVHQVLAPQDRRDRLGDRLGAGGAAEEGAGAEAQGVEDALVLGLAGEEDDGEAGQVAAQGGGDVQPGQPRQLHVHQRQVRALRNRDRQCLMTVHRLGDHLHARVVLEDGFQPTSVQGLVVDNYDSVPGRIHHVLASFHLDERTTARCLARPWSTLTID